MNLGNAITTARKEKGIKQLELSKRTGISQTALSRIEHGTRPNGATIRKICRALGITESFLYVLALEKTDVPEKNHVLYDQLFPIVQHLIFTIIK